MFNQKRRYLIVEETDVTAVLTVINKHQGIFSNNDKLAENCGWANDPTKWFVRFYSSDREWGRIAGELTKLGRIYVDVTPSGATNMHFTRN